MSWKRSYNLFKILVVIGLVAMSLLLYNHVFLEHCTEMVFQESSNRITQQYKMLCTTKDKNGISVCKSGDENLITNIVKDVYIDKPESSKQTYNFDHNPPVLDGQTGVPQLVDKILGSKHNGIFIECGGHDGEEISNSLFFELKRNYTGLLIEPNVRSYKKLRNKNRNIKSINACLSRSNLPEIVNFINTDGISGIEDIGVDNFIKWERSKVALRGEKHISKVLCLPFFPILNAIGNPEVDYFSLDVEGSEFPILYSIPWEKIKIKVLSVEVAHSDKSKIQHFMEENGYILAHELPPPPYTLDHIYVSRDTWNSIS